eukprot:g3902.t1
MLKKATTEVANARGVEFSKMKLDLRTSFLGFSLCDAICAKQQRMLEQVCEDSEAIISYFEDYEEKKGQVPVRKDKSLHETQPKDESSNSLNVDETLQMSLAKDKSEQSFDQNAKLMMNRLDTVLAVAKGVRTKASENQRKRLPRTQLMERTGEKIRKENYSSRVPSSHGQSHMLRERGRRSRSFDIVSSSKRKNANSDTRRTATTVCTSKLTSSLHHTWDGRAPDKRLCEEERDDQPFARRKPEEQPRQLRRKRRGLSRIEAKARQTRKELSGKCENRKANFACKDKNDFNKAVERKECKIPHPEVFTCTANFQQWHEHLLSQEVHTFWFWSNTMNEEAVETDLLAQKRFLNRLVNVSEHTNDGTANTEELRKKCDIFDSVTKGYTKTYNYIKQNAVANNYAANGEMNKVSNVTRSIPQSCEVSSVMKVLEHLQTMSKALFPGGPTKSVKRIDGIDDPSTTVWSCSVCSLVLPNLLKPAEKDVCAVCEAKAAKVSKKKKTFFEGEDAQLRDKFTVELHKWMRNFEASAENVANQKCRESLELIIRIGKAQAIRSQLKSKNLDTITRSTSGSNILRTTENPQWKCFHCGLTLPCAFSPSGPICDVCAASSFDEGGNKFTKILNDNETGIFGIKRLKMRAERAYDKTINRLSAEKSKEAELSKVCKANSTNIEKRLQRSYDDTSSTPMEILTPRTKEFCDLLDKKEKEVDIDSMKRLQRYTQMDGWVSNKSNRPSLLRDSDMIWNDLEKNIAKIAKQEERTHPGKSEVSVIVPSGFAGLLLTPCQNDSGGAIVKGFHPDHKDSALAQDNEIQPGAKLIAIGGTSVDRMDFQEIEMLLRVRREKSRLMTFIPVIKAKEKIAGKKKAQPSRQTEKKKHSLENKIRNSGRERLDSTVAPVLAQRIGKRAKITQMQKESYLVEAKENDIKKKRRVSSIEKRIDATNGNAYSKSDFQAFYGGLKEWETAERIEEKGENPFSNDKEKTTKDEEEAAQLLQNGWRMRDARIEVARRK